MFIIWKADCTSESNDESKMVVLILSVDIIDLLVVKH